MASEQQPLILSAQKSATSELTAKIADADQFVDLEVYAEVEGNIIELYAALTKSKTLCFEKVPVQNASGSCARNKNDER